MEIIAVILLLAFGAFIYSRIRASNKQKDVNPGGPVYPSKPNGRPNPE